MGIWYRCMIWVPFDTISIVDVTLAVVQRSRSNIRVQLPVIIGQFHSNRLAFSFHLFSLLGILCCYPAESRIFKLLGKLVPGLKNTILGLRVLHQVILAEHWLIILVLPVLIPVQLLDDLGRCNKLFQIFSATGKMNFGGNNWV